MALARQIALSLSLLGTVVLIAGCGGSGSSSDLTGKPFTTQNRDDFTGKLDKIDGYVNEGRCDTAQNNLDALVTAVNDVAPDTDEGLKTDLLDLLDQLRIKIDTDCVPAETTTSTTSSSTDSSTTDSSSTTSSSTDSSSTDSSSTTSSSTDSSTTDPSSTTPNDGFNPGLGTPPGHGGENPGNSGGTAPRGEKDSGKGKNGKKPKNPKQTKTKDGEK